MTMPENYWQEMYAASPFPYNYVFVYSDEQLDWFGEWLIKEYNGVFGDDDAVWAHIANIRKVEQDGANGLVYWQNNDFPAVVYVPVSKHYDQGQRRQNGMQSFLNTLSHELSHLALFVCYAVGYNPVVEQEPFCYLVGRMMGQALDEANLPFYLPDLKTLVTEASEGKKPVIDHNIMDGTPEPTLVRGSRGLRWDEFYALAGEDRTMPFRVAANMVESALLAMPAVTCAGVMVGTMPGEDVVVNVKVRKCDLLALKSHDHWHKLFDNKMEFTNE